jgi:hypothetical protein
LISTLSTCTNWGATDPAGVSVAAAGGAVPLATGIAGVALGEGDLTVSGEGDSTLAGVPLSGRGLVGVALPGPGLPESGALAQPLAISTATAITKTIQTRIPFESIPVVSPVSAQYVYAGRSLAQDDASQVHLTSPYPQPRGLVQIGCAGLTR